MGNDENQQEKRRSVRIAAGRPARVYFSDGGNDISIHGDIIDISSTGCRFILKREHITFDNKKLSGKHFRLKTNLDPTFEVEFNARIMWNQIFHSEFLIIGGQFDDIDSLSLSKIENFTINRQKAGLELFTNETLNNDYSAMQLLDEALEVECVSNSVKTSNPYRFALHRISKNSMELIYAPKEFETIEKPELGDTLDVTVYPPSWTVADLRALRFAGKVAKVGENGAVIDFGFSGHDIKQMILNLIPHKKADKGDLKVNYYYVLVILAIIIAWLLTKV